MTEKQIQKVEVVGTLIFHGPKILSVFNPKWGAFTFPMSKRKFFHDSALSAAATPEKLERAAARVAAEVLGSSFAPGKFPQPLLIIKGFEQSDADGVWKLYEFFLFKLQVSEPLRLAPGILAEWMNPQELKTHEPVTHTARYILDQLNEKGLLKNSA